VSAAILNEIYTHNGECQPETIALTEDTLDFIRFAFINRVNDKSYGTLEKHRSYYRRQ